MVENRAQSLYAEALKAQEGQEARIESKMVGKVRIEYSDDPEDQDEYTLGHVFRVQADHLLILDPRMTMNTEALQAALSALQEQGIDVQQADGRYIAVVDEDFAPEDIVVDGR